MRAADHQVVWASTEWDQLVSTTDFLGQQLEQGDVDEPEHPFEAQTTHSVGLIVLAHLSIVLLSVKLLK